MSEVQPFLDVLINARLENDSPKAARAVTEIVNFFEDEPSDAQIDTGISVLFSSSGRLGEEPGSLPSQLRKMLGLPSFADSVCSILDLTTRLLDSFQAKMTDYVEEIVLVCCKVLSSSARAKVLEMSYHPLLAVVRGPWPEYVQALVEAWANRVPRASEKPTIKAREYQLLGSLCLFYPHLVEPHSERIASILLSTIEHANRDQAKVSFPLLESAIKSISHFLENYSLGEMDDHTLYDAVKIFADPGDQHRRTCSRACYQLVAHHGVRYRRQLHADLLYWHPLLLRMCDDGNKDDRRAACSAIFSLYRCVGRAIKEGGPCECLQYLMSYFKRRLSPSPTELSSDLHTGRIALRSFAALVSSCMDVLDQRDVSDVAHAIAQRATLVTNEFLGTEATNLDISKGISELCSYVEAIASMEGVLSQQADKLEALKSLCRALVVHFPRCQLVQRNMAITALKAAFSSIDIQSTVDFMVKESCRHSMSLSLYCSMEGNSLRANPAVYSCENFLPLWAGVLEDGRVMTALLPCVRKLLTTLDPSVDQLKLHILSGEVFDPDADDLGSYETPVSQFEYRLLTNVCDLTATLIRHTGPDLAVDRRVPDLLGVCVGGALRHPRFAGFLTLAEAILELYQDPSDYEEIKIVTQDLLKSLSISNRCGLLQLRTALVLLKMPAPLLDEDLIHVAADAYLVVLRVGKTNLQLATTALKLLDHWDELVSRETLRPLLQKIMPILREYLCSSGIVDSHILESPEGEVIRPARQAIATKKKLQEGTSKQLVTLQKQIMLFLGKMDSVSLAPILQGGEEEAGQEAEARSTRGLADLLDKLLLSLPCPQHHHLDIYLDTLVPRVTDLALNSTNRDTRLIACQALHSMMLLLYGTSVSIPESQQQSLAATLRTLTASALTLAADADGAVADMFWPLLCQTCHWLATPRLAATPQASDFIHALLEGCAHPTNSAVREKACASVRELVCWSARLSGSDLASTPPSAQAILRAVCHMALHPDQFRKRGAFLIFNGAIALLYKSLSSDGAINQFLPDLLYCTVKSLDSGNGEPGNDIHKEEALKSLHIILKCFLLKAHIFKTPSTSRRKPPGFGQATLHDIALWLLERSKTCRCQSTADKMLNSFVKISTVCVGSAKLFVKNLIEQNGVPTFLSKYFDSSELNLEVVTDFDGFFGYLISLSSSLNVYMFAIQNYLIDTSTFLDGAKKPVIKILEYLKCFYSQAINKFYLTKSDDASKNANSFTKKQSDLIEDLLFRISWNGCRFLTSLPETEIALEECLVSIAKWLTDFSRLSIMKRNLETHQYWSIKKTIEYIKANVSNIQWTIFESKLIKNLSTRDIGTYFSSFNQHAEIKNTSLLSYVKDIINTVDPAEMKPVIESWNLEDSLVILFSMITIDEDESVKFYSEIDASVLKSMGDMIDFILSTDVIKTDALLLLVYSSKKMSEGKTLGQYFLKSFEAQLIPYLISHCTEVFTYISKNIDDINYPAHILLLEEIMVFGSSKEFCGPTFQEALTALLFKFWPRFDEWYGGRKQQLVRLHSLLVILLPEPLSTMGGGENSMSAWLLSRLSDASVSLQDKTKLIPLLPTVAPPSCEENCYTQRLGTALDSVRRMFPLSWTEHPARSTKRAAHMAGLIALLEASANSGSWAILQCLVRATAVDKDHILEEQILHKLRSLSRRLSPEQLVSVLQCMLVTVTERGTEPELRLTVLRRFFIPLLTSAPLPALEEFYSDAILMMLTMLDQKLGDPGTRHEYQLNHRLVGWNVAYNMAEIMFVQVPSAVLISKISVAVNRNRLTPIRLTKDFLVRCIKIREETIEDHYPHSQELLRTVRCSAYNCLYAMVVALSQENGKAYTILLRNSVATWRGLLDPQRIYTFPMAGTSKFKLHSVANRNNDQSGVLGENSMSALPSSILAGPSLSTEQRRRQSLAESLSQDAYNYDLNLAHVRDPVTDNLDQAEMQEVGGHVGVRLETGDLNDHECMATMCEVIRMAHRLTAAGNMTPDWAYFLGCVLEASSPHQDVRLFILQAILNVRDSGKDIFKESAAHFLQPVLEALKERCHENHQLDYMDTSLIAMLLSWSEIIVPDSANDCSLASSVLEFILDQINPNTQTPEMHRHTLQLFRAILSKWKELELPIDSILKKLNSFGKQKKTTITICIISIENSYKPWFDKNTFERYKKLMIDSTHAAQKDEQLFSFEALGLTLKILQQDDPQEFDLLLENMQINLKNMFLSSPEKLAPCLHAVQKNCLEISNLDLASKICFLIPKFPSEAKKVCLKVLLQTLERFGDDELVLNVLGLPIEELLRDRFCQEEILRILLKIESKKSYRWLPQICELAASKDSTIRSAAYDLLMIIYAAETDDGDIKMDVSDMSAIQQPTFSQTLSQKRPLNSTLIPETLGDLQRIRRSPAAAALLRALDDDDELLKRKAFIFWSERFSSDIHSRWLSVAGVVLAGDGKGSELSWALRLLLAVCYQTPSFHKTKLFQHPLEDCMFQEHSIDTSSRRAAQSLAPMFALTLNSQLLLSSQAVTTARTGGTAAPVVQLMLQATMDNFNLGTSMSLNTASASVGYVPDHSQATDSSLLASSELELVQQQRRKTFQRKSQGKTEQEEADNDLERKLRRKLIEDKNMQALKFGSDAANKKILKAKRRLAEPPVAVLRKFRAGDYPDVQMSMDDVLAPLLGLSSRDQTFAKDMFIIVFKSLLRHMSQSDAAERHDSLRQQTAELACRTISSEPHATVTLAMLQLCRLLPKEFGRVLGSGAVNGVAQVAKSWLGGLLMDEAAMCAQDDELPIKKLKLEAEGGEAVGEKLRREERLLRKAMRWQDLLQLYADSISQPTITDADKHHCADEYFVCLAELSNWEDLVTEMQSQLCPHQELDYDLLWKTPRTRTALLPLAIEADIHRNSSIAISSFLVWSDFNPIQQMASYMHQWLRDKTKKAALCQDLLPMISLWMSTMESDSVMLNDAMEMLKEKLSMQKSVPSADTLAWIQMVAEGYRFREWCPQSDCNSQEMQSDKTREAVRRCARTWSHCTPNPGDSTRLWNLRLACRAMYTAQLDVELSEELVDVWKKAQLALVTAAVQQGHGDLAELYVDKYQRLLKGEEKRKWQVQHTKALVIKVDQVTDPKLKMSAILDAWKIGENTRTTLEVDSRSVCTLLQQEAVMATAARRVLATSPHLVSYDIFRMSQGDSQPSEPFLDPLLLTTRLINYSTSCLLRSVNEAEKTIFSKEDHLFLADAYLALAKHCDQVIQDNTSGEHDALVAHLVCGVLRAAQHGSEEAPLLLPLLLLRLEGRPDDDQAIVTFLELVAAVPRTVWLPWLPQVLAQAPAVPSLCGLLLELAQHQPGHLSLPYRLARTTWLGHASLKTTVEQLDAILMMDSETETLVRALGWLRDPLLLLGGHLKDLVKAARSQDKAAWDAALSETFSSVYHQESGSGPALRGLIFQHLSKFKNQLEKLKQLSPECEKDMQQIEEALRSLDASLKTTQVDYPSGSRSLKDFSPHLAAYEALGGGVLLPGQEYRPGHQITIARFHQEVLVMRSLRRPMKVTMLGSDGRSYSYLVKHGEDLRQDHRLQQLFCLMNHSLSAQGMPIASYKVVPLSCDFGLIQWVEGCATLLELARHGDPAFTGIMEGLRQDRLKQLAALEGSDMAEQYGNMAANLSDSRAAYEMQIKKIPPYLLRDALQKLAVSPENFVRMRAHYAGSLASMSVAHWILGIGDRHLENMLLCLKSGRLVGIDFGHALGTATQLLPIPELMPCRLTPQLLAVLAPQGKKGVLRDMMVEALENLEARTTLLMAAMGVMVREPALGWLRHAHWTPADKVNQVKRKLCGALPTPITLEDVGLRGVSLHHNKHYERVLVQATPGQLREHHRAATADQQVDCLLSVATDPGVLSVTYAGWFPWF